MSETRLRLEDETKDLGDIVQFRHLTSFDWLVECGHTEEEAYQMVTEQIRNEAQH